MSSPRFRCAVLSAVKHDYVARGMASHPQFELVVVADDPEVPEWAHERNQQLADDFGIPCIRDVSRARFRNLMSRWRSSVQKRNAIVISVSGLLLRANMSCRTSLFPRSAARSIALLQRSNNTA